MHIAQLILLILCIIGLGGIAYLLFLVKTISSEARAEIRAQKLRSIQVQEGLMELHSQVILKENKDVIRMQAKIEELLRAINSNGRK
jgi:hypothetical protein